MSSVRQKNNRAFTLIELLVVVAIIAILASIAVVNLAEAQTRSKASRSKSDLRAVVTALEAYAVDHNHYPTYHYLEIVEFHIGGRVPAWGMPDPAWDGRNPVTTPIAYITQFPADPFAGHHLGRSRERKEFLYVNWDYAVQQVTTGTWPQIFQYARFKYGPYRLHSLGPDGDGPDSGIVYDPTNGTNSDGDITYGPNVGFEHYIFFPSS